MGPDKKRLGGVRDQQGLSYEALGCGAGLTKGPDVKVLAKVVKGDETRKTRFHTAKGRLIGPRAWLDLPRALWLRGTGRMPDHPWMAPEAVRLLARSITSQWKVLELGSGTSTAWFASRAGQVVSFEDQPDWHRTVAGTVKGFENCELHLCPLEETLERIRAMDDDSFDLVVVDANDSLALAVSRYDLAEVARTKVKHGGMLVFDDLDKPRHQSAGLLFGDWPARYERGIKGHPLTAVETAIFRRP